MLSASSCFQPGRRGKAQRTYSSNCSPLDSIHAEIGLNEPWWVWSWRHLLCMNSLQIRHCWNPPSFFQRCEACRMSPWITDRCARIALARAVPAGFSHRDSIIFNVLCSHQQCHPLCWGTDRVRSFSKTPIKKHSKFIFMYLTSHTVYPWKSMRFPEEPCYLINFKWWWICSCSVNYNWCHFQEASGWSTFTAMLALST